MEGHVDVAEELLDRGAHLYNRFGQRVADMAARRSNFELSPSIVSLLLEVAMERDAAECEDEEDSSEDDSSEEDDEVAET